MMYRGMIALFLASSAVHIGAAALGAYGWVPVATGALPLALLAGYVVTAPSGDPGGVSGRARALLCGGLLAAAVAIVASWEARPRPGIPPAGGYQPVDLDAGRPLPAIAIALTVALAAFLLGIAGLPPGRRGAFVTAALAMLSVFGVAAALDRVAPVPNLPMLFGGPVRMMLSLAAGYAIAVFLLLRAARRRGFPVSAAGVLLAAGVGAVVLRLADTLETLRATVAYTPPTDAFLQPGVRYSTAVAVTGPGTDAVWAGPDVTLHAVLLLAGPLLIVAGALQAFRAGPNRRAPQEP